MRPLLLLLFFLAEALAVLRAPPLAPRPHFQRYAAVPPRNPRVLPPPLAKKKPTFPLDAAIQTVMSVFKPKEFKTAPLPVSSRSTRPFRLPLRPNIRVKPQLNKFLRRPPHGGKSRPGPAQTRHVQQRPISKQRLHPHHPPPHLRRPPIKPQITLQANLRPQARPA